MTKDELIDLASSNLEDASDSPSKESVARDLIRFNMPMTRDNAMLIIYGDTDYDNPYRLIPAWVFELPEEKVTQQ